MAEQPPDWKEACGTVLVQFRLPPGPETLAVAAKRLGVQVSALDASYGVVATDPADRLFTALVRSELADQVATRLCGGDQLEGVFSNPRIEPFDPPQP